MSGVNKVIIVGRLGSDPEMKNIASGQTVTRLNVATSENWLGKDGTKQERTEWHRVSVWGKIAEVCAKHLTKGSQVYVEGRLQTRSYEDSQGNKKYITEIVANSVQFLDSLKDKQNGNLKHNQNSNQLDFGPDLDFDDSEQLPF